MQLYIEIDNSFSFHVMYQMSPDKILENETIWVHHRLRTAEPLGPRAKQGGSLCITHRPPKIFVSFLRYIYNCCRQNVFIVPLRRTELTVESPQAKCETRARSCCMAKVSVFFVYLFTNTSTNTSTNTNKIPVLTLIL